MARCLESVLLDMFVLFCAQLFGSDKCHCFDGAVWLKMNVLVVGRTRRIGCLLVATLVTKSYG